MVADTVIGLASRRHEAETPFGRTEGLGSPITGVLIVGAYLGGTFGVQWGWLFFIFISLIVCLLGLSAVERFEQAEVPLTLVSGARTGPAGSPTLAYYVPGDLRAAERTGGGS